MVESAVTWAKKERADRVQAFPVIPKYKSKAVPAAFAHTGVPTIFDRAGFERVGQAVRRVRVIANVGQLLVQSRPQTITELLDPVALFRHLL